MKQLMKCASFTDIHWGAKSNSELHNQDCERFIAWFCEKVRSDPLIDHVIFMGDWYESRSAINIQTLSYSHRGAVELNKLGIPIFFVIGNHDLYHRNTREVYSPITFEALSNFTIVNEPKVFKNIGQSTGALISPYLMHDEYANLGEYLSLETWWGHFEFKGFVITGYNITMPSGPDPDSYSGPKHIFSGHFHKRQTTKNITYIGNAFPSSFGDVNDDKRGMMVYDHAVGKPTFHDWKECPRYVRVNVSDLIEPNATLPKQSRVKCILDLELSIDDLAVIREDFTERFSLRDLNFVDVSDLSSLITDTPVNVETEAESDTTGNMTMHDGATVDQLVVQLLQSIESDKINANTLVDQYKTL